MLRAQPAELPKAGTLFGEEKRINEEIQAADKLAQQRRWDDAVRRYMQILSEAGDQLVWLGAADRRRSVPARWLVHQKLAAIDPAARKLYRAQLDGPARKWLEDGIARRDPRLLERIIHEAFCSTPAESALQILGDLAFERGEFESAARWWRLLARPASEPEALADRPNKFELTYPDPSDGGALARAKQILALMFLGDNARAKDELEAFRRKHDSAAGALAGRKGTYVEILQGLIKSRAALGLSPPASGSTTWPTFAGDAARNFRVPTAATPYWPDSPLWRVPLPGEASAKPHRDSDPPPGTSSAARGLAFHPAIVPGFALVADAARVNAFDLLTGKRVAQYDHRDQNQLPDSLDLRVPSRTDARYTLTVAGDRIYARFGAQPMRSGNDGAKPHETDTAIVCLALDREGSGSARLRYRWQIRSRLVDTEPPALFEGAPAVRDGRLYVAKSRFEGRQVITSIDCYDADAPEGRDEPPPLRWRQDVWGIEPAGTAESARQRHDLLTLAGPNVVFCTHSGLIIALDAATGKRAWAYRYPVAAGRGIDGVLPQDLSPCVCAQGRIYAAPLDADGIFCLDARTGETIWESSPAYVVQLLGVSHGRLFATLGGFPQGLRCYDAAKGTPLWTRPDDGDRATFGRGFLTDQWIFWPTRHGLKVLRQDDGEALDAGSSSEPMGNLAFGEGCLLVATAQELWGFVPERLRLGERQKAVDENHHDALALYRLALAKADAGGEAEALADFRKVEELSDAEQFFHGRTIRDLSRHRRFELLVARGERAWLNENKEEALAALREAAGEPFALADRLRAINLLNWADVKELPKFEDLAKVRSMWLTRNDGMPVRGDVGVDDPIGPNLSPVPEPKREPPLYDVRAPLEKTWSVDLEMFHEWLLRPFLDAGSGEEEHQAADPEGRFFFAHGRRIVCRSLSAGRTLWAADVQFEAESCVARGDSVIVAGPLGIARIRTADGEILWHFLAPDPTPMPAGWPEPHFRTLAPPRDPLPLSDFRLAGSRVICRHGCAGILTLDVQSGWPQSRKLAPNRRGAESKEAHWSRHFLAAGDVVLLQTSAGEVIAWNAATNTVLYRHDATAKWTSPPILSAAGHAIFPTDVEHLVCLDLARAKPVWEQTLAYWPSLTGAGPQLRRDGSDFLVLVERNFGYELERRSALTGQRLFGPVFVGCDRPDLNAAAITDAGYCLLFRSEARLYSRDEERVLWKLPLPGGGAVPWRARRTKSSLLIHPAEAVPGANIPAQFEKAAAELSAIPTLDRLHTGLALAYYALARRTFPVLVIDPKTGRVLQELSLPALGPRCALVLSEGRAAAVTEGHVQGLVPDHKP
jgi:outer membrane protein assembly factor BamB